MLLEDYGAGNEVAELRRLFENARDDRSVLEWLNSQLKRLNDDAVNELQMEVVATLIALRGSARRREVRSDPLDALLLSRGLSRPSGCALHRYRLSEGEWATVGDWVKRAHRENGLYGASERASALFVLFAAEWFRREHAGGAYRWEDLGAALGKPLPYTLTVELTRAGLGWWGRHPKVVNGAEERLLSLALEGGFPTRLLESREHGWLSVHLRRSLGRLARADTLDEDTAASSVAAGQSDVPASYHGGEFQAVCAELVLAVASLKREAEGEAPAGVAPSVWLDGARPGWRDDLPIRIEGDGARRLLDELVSTAVDRLVAAGARCRRLLLWERDDWVPAVELSLEGEVRLPASAASHDGRFRVFAAGELADRLAGELALLEPPGDEGGWLSRARGAAVRVVSPFPFQAAIQVELRGEGRTPERQTWAHGEAERGQLLVFVGEESEGGVPVSRLELVGAGSVRSRSPVLYALAPEHFVAEEIAGGAAVEPIWASAASKLFRLDCAARIGSAGDEYAFRVEPAADGVRVERFEISGGVLVGITSTDDEPVYAGPPTLRGRTGASSSTLTGDQVAWRRKGEMRWKTLAEGPIGEGQFEVVWRDPLARAARDRRTLSVLPADVRLNRRPIQNGALFTLENGGDWRLSSACGERLSAVEIAGGLEVRFAGAPQRKISLELRHPRFGGLTVRCSVPMLRGGFVRANDELLRDGQRTVLDRLRGAHVFADGPARLTLELAKKPATRQVCAFVDELALWSLSDDLARLLSAADDLDDDVVLTLDPGACRLRVGRYEGEVLFDRAASTVAFKDPEGDMAARRRLEWRSIIDPSEAGLRVLADRTWAEDAVGRPVELPRDLPGPGIVYARVGDAPRGRPTLVPGARRDVEGLSPLRRAALIPDRQARQAAVVAALNGLFQTDEGAAELRFLHSMLAALDGAPAVSLDVFRHLPRTPTAAAALMLSSADAAERDRVWRLEQQLPLTWVLVPALSWRRGHDFLAHSLELALSAAGLGDSARAIAANQAAIGVEALLSLEPLLQAPLAAAGLCSWPEALPRSHREIAQERVRRSVGADALYGRGGSTSVSCCFDDREFGVELPDYLRHFDQSQWEGLLAPWAAALRSADRIKLTETQRLRVRAALAEDPLHFAEAYSAFLLEFSGA